MELVIKSTNGKPQSIKQLPNFSMSKTLKAAYPAYEEQKKILVGNWSP